MFGIGPQEIMMIVIAALVIFGPQRLPEIAAQAGKALRDFRRMKDELTGELRQNLTLDDPTTRARPLTNTVAPASATPEGVGSAIAQSLRVETITPTPTAPEETSTPTTPTTESPDEDIMIGLDHVAVATKTVRAQGGIADAQAGAIPPEPTSSPARPGLAGDISTTGTMPPVAERPAYAPSQREPVVPHTAPTMRETIEAQVAAEAFRERRRLANYQRARKRDQS
ncbi:MAG: Sec-independent protein translocase subunit TatA/TatB [Solirubrobacteraceae bacterium]